MKSIQMATPFSFENKRVAELSYFGIPLIMKRIGIDPALAGGVVLTTTTQSSKKITTPIAESVPQLIRSTEQSD